MEQAIDDSVLGQLEDNSLHDSVLVLLNWNVETHVKDHGCGHVFGLVSALRLERPEAHIRQFVDLVDFLGKLSLFFLLRHILDEQREEVGDKLRQLKHLLHGALIELDSGDILSDHLAELVHQLAMGVLFDLPGHDSLLFK